MKKDKPMTQDELADFLTLPLQMCRGSRLLYTRVRFFRRKEDGTTERVITAGPSPAVPITHVVDGIDWDMNRTFLETPVTLYVDWGEWLKYLHGG